VLQAFGHPNANLANKADDLKLSDAWFAYRTTSCRVGKPISSAHLKTK